MTTLTEEQAAIVSAYTGYLLGDFGTMHEYIEKIMGRPVWTHEMPRLMDEIRERSRADFLSLTPGPEAAKERA